MVHGASNCGNIGIVAEDSCLIVFIADGDCLELIFNQVFLLHFTYRILSRVGLSLSYGAAIAMESLARSDGFVLLKLGTVVVLFL